MSDAFARPPPRCFQGVVPAAIATCSADGAPNVTYVSQVFYLDEGHVALSCQFFNKTKQNVLENPYAEVQLYDPVSFDAYQLSLRYERAETSGPLFDAMAARIQAIASHTGMAGVFRLISSDVYEVLQCRALEDFLLPDTRPESLAQLELLTGPRSELRGLTRISQATCGARDLEELLGVVLETLDDAFGFEHAMVLLADPIEATDGPRLRLAASHGYGCVPVGAVVRPGQGLIGTVAQQRKLLRFAGLPAELRYLRAVRASAEHTADRAAIGPEIPLPGLPDSQSHLGIPLLVAGRLLGVLAVESRAAAAFDSWHEAFLEIVANQVAMALDNAMLRERQQLSSAATAESPAVSERPSAAGPPLRVQFFRNDDCVFVDGEYLIRNVPGRILYKLLRAHVDSGRTEFSNRELRLDPSLGLPPLRDNLESRLVLLRKRLEQRCPSLRLVSSGRGHFRLEVGCPLELSEADHG